MQKEEFIKCLDLLSFVELEGATYYTKEQELDVGSETVNVPKDSILDYEIGGKKVIEIIEDDSYEILIKPSGGRGSSSSGNGGEEKPFKFNHASGGGGEKLPPDPHFPSEMNDGEKFQSQQKAIDKFRERTADKGREYAITVDDQGFVHKYVTGGSTSVAISAMAGELIVHNHPSGGAFSDSDLLSTAQDRSSGIVATGKNGSYIFRKGKNFNASGFARAVKKATMMGTSYDDAADKWLKANQSKYGYRYEFQKR